MADTFSFPLLENPRRLAELGGWSEGVYADFLAVQAGRLSEGAFRERYAARRAILVLDLTGFTEAAMEHGALYSFLRIVDAQKVIAPVFAEHGALHARTFADDFTGTFHEPEAALDCALEIQRRVEAFNRSPLAPDGRAAACIGLGVGEVFLIGPDQAMGDEMNRASKLGEDTACGGEILLTGSFRDAVRHRRDCPVERVADDALPFAYWRVQRPGGAR